MTSHLHFDFSVNKDNNTIHVEREFAGDLETVWDCWTRPELLDLWWAPKPYRTRTKSMDFREGGTWLYAMISPENVPHWCRADYQSIDPHKSFSGLDAFCDEMGQINTEFPRSLWNNRFSAGEGVTRVVVVHVVVLRGHDERDVGQRCEAAGGGGESGEVAVGGGRVLVGPAALPIDPRVVLAPVAAGG